MEEKQLEENESGQAIVLVALLLLALVAAVGLAVDGGNVLNGRRVTQNAADSGVLSGLHYLSASDAPTETELRSVINGMIEANGVSDTDAIAGNEINDNITIYYTDDSGNRLTSQPCHLLPCGAIPPPAQGLDVEVQNQVVTFFLGVVGRDTVEVGASAKAVVRGGSDGNSNIGDNALVSFGSCPESKKPMDMSANNIDVLGGVHSDTFFENRGQSNHYHGLVTYGITTTGFIDTASPLGTYDQAPAQAGPFGDPLAALGLSVGRFACSTGDIGSAVPPATCYDLTTLAPLYGNEVTTQLLKQNSPDGGAPYLDEASNQLRDGLYYAGPYPITIGEPEMFGTVTLVSSDTIKLTEPDLQLTGYMTETSPIPGLLFYSSYQAADPCSNAVPAAVINLTGSSGSVPPGVFHADDKVGCVDPNNTSACAVYGSLQYIGLIYAPGGRVATSGDGATYVGAIVAPSIRVNGFRNRSEGGPGEPDRVGVLFVHDSNLFPATAPFIFLDE